MSNDHDSLFFVVRKGEVWACWLDARSPIKLGAADAVIAAMTELLSEQNSAATDQTGGTTPPLPQAEAERPIIKRSAERHDVSVIGRLRTARGTGTVTIHDLSKDGCQIYDELGLHAEGDRVTIRIGTIGPIGATVIWSGQKRLGVRFEHALHTYVVDHIRASMDIRS
jgi:hypothetical protein